MTPDLLKAIQVLKDMGSEGIPVTGTIQAAGSDCNNGG